MVIHGSNWRTILPLGCSGTGISLRAGYWGCGDGDYRQYRYRTSHSSRLVSQHLPSPFCSYDTALTGYIRNGAITKVDRKASCHQHGSVDTQPHKGIIQPPQNYATCRSDKLGVIIIPFFSFFYRCFFVRHFSSLVKYHTEKSGQPPRAMAQKNQLHKNNLKPLPFKTNKQ